MPAIVRVGDPLWINRALSTRDARVATAGLLSTIYVTDHSEARPGVLPDDGLSALKVGPTVPGQSMAVRVEPGHAVLTQAGQGPWIVPIEQPVVLDVPAAPPTNSRVDAIVARVYDLDQGDTPPVPPDTGGRGVATVELITGDVSATPTAPPTPARAVLLGTITTVPSTTSIGPAAITDRRVWTVARGGIRPVSSPTDPARPSYPGEVTATPSGLLRVGVTDAAKPWRGVQAPPPIVTIPGTPNYPTKVTTTYVMPTVTIPDPGFPYQVDVRGTMMVTADTALTLGLVVATPAWTGTRVCVQSNVRGATGVRQSAHIGSSLWTVYSGPLTIGVAVFIMGGAGSDGYNVDPVDSVVSIRVVPWTG